MLVPGDLGFPGFLIFFFLVPVIGLLIRRQWRISEERNLEIMRLMAMASEEAKRVEYEASIEYGTVPIVYQCALCFAPTTTRCSRCKAVRYCSGKCQIIHWRQGHREECRPPSSNIQLNSLGGNSGRNTILEGEKQEFIDNDLVVGKNSDFKSLDTFPREAGSPESSGIPALSRGKQDAEVGSSGDVRVADIISVSSSKLVGSAKPTSTISLDDVSAGELPVSSSPDRSEATLGSTIKGLDKKHDVDDTEITVIPASKLNNLEGSMDSFSCQINSSKATRGRSSAIGDSRRTSSSDSSFKSSKISPNYEPSKIKLDSSKGAIDSDEPRNDVKGEFNRSYSKKGANADSGDQLQFSFNPTQHAVTSSHPEYSIPNTLKSEIAYPVTLENKSLVREARVAQVDRNKPVYHFSRSASVNSNSTSNSKHLKPKAVRSLSLSEANGNVPSATGEHSVVNSKVSKAGDVQEAGSRLSQTASTLQNAGNGLKTSMQKVVQQFKGAKPEKPYLLGLGTHAAGKRSYKMLFPYDLFVKLYNKDKAELYPCGLTNCGNSCYANAVLQCLAFTRPLTAYFLQGLHSKACRREGWCFTCELQNLVLMAKEGRMVLSPVAILSQLNSIGSSLGNGREEDAHEFLRYAIDKMQSDCLKEASTNTSPIAEETTLVGLIFGGYLRSEIKCMKCRGKSEKHERMMDLTVEIEGDIATLEDALGKFTAIEILDEQNKYHCSRCKSYEKAKKKLTVFEAPNVLTIVLKRFQSGKFGKLNKSVRFPEVLDLAPYMSGSDDNSPVYSLYAVVVHLDIMNAAFSGHYVCYVKNSQGKWFKIDDSTVKPVERDRVLSKEAYMLLYARCSPRAPGLIRSAMLSHESKSKPLHFFESVPSSNGVKNALSRARPPRSVISSAVPSIAHCNHEDCRKKDRPAILEGIQSFDRRYHIMNQQIPRGEDSSSSSDSCSLFSCSDEGSCSTESTRESITADEFLSDYIFGNTVCSSNSPLRVSDESNSSSPLSSSSFAVSPETSWTRRVAEDEEDRDRREKGNNPILYSDRTSDRCKKLNRSSSNRESSDSERIAGWGNSIDVRSGLSLRRSTKEKTTQPFN